MGGGWRRRGDLEKDDGAWKQGQQERQTREREPESTLWRGTFKMEGNQLTQSSAIQMLIAFKSMFLSWHIKLTITDLGRPIYLCLSIWIYRHIFCSLFLSLLPSSNRPDPNSSPNNNV